MTDKDIAAMREDAEEARKVLSGSYTIPREGVEALAMGYATQCAEQMPLVLDEVERLREIVRVVADFDTTEVNDGAFACHWCGAMYDGIGDKPAEHPASCPVVKARALLGMENK